MSVRNKLTCGIKPKEDAESSYLFSDLTPTHIFSYH